MPTLTVDRCCEQLFYFSCFALAFALPYHPLHLLLNKYHTDLSALGGHDGYGSPAADDVGHYLHHKHFECNYASIDTFSICLLSVSLTLKASLFQGFSFPNYLDRLAGTYENGDRFLNAAERKELGLPPKKPKAALDAKTE